MDNPDTWANLPKAAMALVVTNETVGPLYAKRLCAALKSHYGQVMTLVMPDGESHKNWQTLNLIFDQLLEKGADRQTVLFALGGGVVGDMTGFAAACYMRGVPFVQVPTTLLSQVDSSVGGKTAINHPLGKNMIGAFYQPQRVVCDLDTLQTLPPRELSAGLAEVIKYGPIADMQFLDWLEKNLDALMARDPKALFWVQIAHSIQYLAFPIRMELNGSVASRKTTRTPFQIARHMAIYAAALLVVSILVSQIVPNALMGVVAGAFGEEPGRAAPILILMFINIHHYFTDGVLWKISNPEVRAQLFAHAPPA